jgi:hypothetical protein
MVVKPRHPDCTDCKFFNRHRVNTRCVPCGAGEFFEEKIVDRAPNDNELMIMFAGMSEYYDDLDNY